MASGASVDDAVVAVYNDIKIKKNKMFAVMSFNDDYSKVILVDSGTLEDAKALANETFGQDSEEKQFEAFREKYLKNDVCCYAIYDTAYKTASGDQRNKIAFITWAAEDAKIKDKMLMSSTKDAVKKKLEGIHAEIQANDISDLSFEILVSKLEKK